ncbi:MAG: aminotransferase class I/II-fold pyridoxal phosphate-dependent enzyme [Chloroflexi bacterium]|nr:aminotransferase class I/II-fold pyridoxal phosphate-dependent enzyme [Chloroflexota bacterium]
MIPSLGDTVTVETPSGDGHLWEAEGSVVFRGDGDPRTPESTLRRLAELEGPAIEADTYSRGGAVEKLEARFAEMLEKESAVFMPTGTLANHLAIRQLCGIRQKAIVQEQSHLYNDSGDCVTRLSGISLVPLAPGRPSFTLEELKEAVERSGDARVATPIGAVMVESPVRRQYGQVVPFDQMRQITDFCRDRGFGSHLDGARLYMMSAATGVSPKEYAALFDTVYVSLYKYFGAPFGAVLAGTAEFTKDLYHERRMFGGGLSSAYLAAALASKGSEDFEARFAAAMGRATELLAGLEALEGINVERFRHGSNIFPVMLGPEVDAETFVAALRRQSVFVYADDHESSWITLTVNPTILSRSTVELLEAFKEALSEGARAAGEDRVG